MAFTHWKNNRSPSIADVIRVDGAPFNLTAAGAIEVRFKMRALAETALKVDAVAQITDAVNGAVRHDWAALDVDTDGEFVAWWEVALPAGKKQDSPEFLIVVLEHEPITRALCSVEDVKWKVPGLRNQDGLTVTPYLLRLIVAESDYMHRTSGRELTPRAANPQTRLFDLSPWNVRERRARVGDLRDATGLVVKVKNAAGSILATVAAADYVLLAQGGRRQKEPWEPYVQIAFPPGTPNGPSLSAGDVLELAGNWGFPSIPDALREECAYNVAAKYSRTAPASPAGAEEVVALRSTYRVTNDLADPGFA